MKPSVSLLSRGETFTAARYRFQTSGGFDSISLMEKQQTVKAKSSGKQHWFNFSALHAQFENSFIEICVRKSPTESKHGVVGAVAART